MLTLRELFENQFPGGTVGIFIPDINPFNFTRFID